ncbi:hypothetical protein [Catenuloplanes atrovinosus]|uniref:Uncharacterized protein n=1 Tax=Catenuloplanes atrovinosus TaxID=137266 RepID=A0AAE4CA07_9ACTN|nr:hypothetical protein [Catenuloplanes atrovinosus]MDR7276568.1 hypothetical protein [Catenuloplanes atrovinosus]
MVVGAPMLAGVCTAVVHAVREDSDVAACRRIDDFSQELARGGAPTVTESEARKPADQLADSRHEKVARLGDVIRRSYDTPDDDRPIDGMYGAVLLTGVCSVCLDAGIPMTRPLPPPR